MVKLLMVKDPSVQRGKDPIQYAQVEREQENEHDNYGGCRPNLSPGGAVDKLHFQPHFFKEFREVSDFLEYSDPFRCHGPRLLPSILLRQETRFLSGLTSCARQR